MATFLLLLCIAAGCGVIGILFMLYGPTSTGFPRIRTVSVPTPGFFFAPPPAPPPPYPIGFMAEGSSPIRPAPQPFVPVPNVSTDFSMEEPVREVRIRSKSPSPPPLPPVTPLPPEPKAAPPPLPKAAQTVAIAPPSKVRAEATPTTPPRLGVSAPSARARHLEPPRRMPPPMPRTRSARGSDAPPPNDRVHFATDQQRTVPRELDEFSTAEHTFVD